MLGCQFEHKNIDKEVFEIQNKHEELNIKINNLDKAIAEKDQEINVLANTIETLKKSFVDDVLSKMNNLEKLVEKQAIVINDLENKVNLLSHKEPKSRNVKASANNLNCSKCDFVGTTSHGLKVHIARKHTVNLNQNSRNCELCDKTFKNNIELKKHLNAHSYKQANYKCKECDFVGERHESMDVHIGRFHTDTYECGLCHFSVDSFEKLETHQLTCEIFRCCICEESKHTEKTLTQIKEHVKSHHEPDEFDSLLHLKMDRNNPDEVNCTRYYWKEV